MAASAEAPALFERIPARTRVEDWVWTPEYAVPLVERQLNVRSLEGFGLNGHEPAAIAAGAAPHYVRLTQKNDALHIDSLKFEEHSTALELDHIEDTGEGSTLIIAQLFKEIYDTLAQYGDWSTLGVRRLGTKITNFPIKTARTVAQWLTSRRPRYRTTRARRVRR